MYCFLSFVSYFIFIDFFFHFKLVQLLIVHSFFAESFPPGWTNRMFWWTIYPSKSLWFENNSFILDLYFCFWHSFLHMFSFFSCLSLIASMLPKYLCIFLHSMHVSNQIFLFTNYFSSSTLSIVYLPSIHLFFSSLILKYWLTYPLIFPWLYCLLISFLIYILILFWLFLPYLQNPLCEPLHVWWTIYHSESP